MLLKIVAIKLQRRFFPTPHDLMVRKWLADGGDQELRFNYDLDKNSVMLDVGGYQGQNASDFFSRFQCRIYVFEPVLNFAEQIKKRFCKNSSIEVFQFGLGASSRIETLHICGDGSSIFRRSSQAQEIKIVDIKEWLQEKNIRHIDLMKINIEGGEYELLERLIETNLIEIIDNIQVQFHDIVPGSRARMANIQKELRKTHRPIYQYEFDWENWARKR